LQVIRHCTDNHAAPNAVLDTGDQAEHAMLSEPGRVTINVLQLQQTRNLT
jgi:hypothetical protein